MCEVVWTNTYEINYKDILHSMEEIWLTFADNYKMEP